MKVTAWNNGSYQPDGNGYGIKINARDRDAFFNPNWKRIQLELEGEVGLVEININKPGFWNETCRELISVRIGRWLIKNKLVPWTKGSPPTMNLIPIKGNQFRIFTN